MVTTINNSVSPATGPSGAAPSSAVPSSAPVSAGAIGGGFVPTTLFALSMPVADAGLSGLRAPLNPEDAGALLLLAEASLDQTNAETHAASLASRFGEAGNDLAAADQAVGGRQAVLKNAQMVADLQQQIVDAPSGADTSTLQLQLTAAKAALSEAQAAVGVTPTAADPDKTDEQNDLAAVTDAQNDLDRQVRTATTSLSQIATGLRSDIGKDADQTNQTTQRRDIAYRDIGNTTKRFRDGEVARARHDGQAAADRQAQAARSGEAKAPRTAHAPAPDGDRGSELAAQLAAALQNAIPVLRDFAATPPPAVSQTAAFEANGRVRLSL